MKKRYTKTMHEVQSDMSHVLNDVLYVGELDLHRASVALRVASVIVQAKLVEDMGRVMRGKMIPHT